MDSPSPAKKSPRNWRRFLWRVARLPVVVYLGVVVMLMLMENSMIFFPSRHPEGFWKPVGLNQEDAWFTADDGTKLHGWFVPPANTQENPRAVALFAHGNAGNITDRLERLQYFQRIGVAVLAFDYRGYGQSEGSPNEAGVLADARAARAWLAKRAGVQETEIVLIGESLGGAVMVDLAAKDGAAGLILESTFTSLPDVAAHHYRWLPVRLLMRSRLDALGQIGNYHGPVLWSHGTADEVIPYEFGTRLFEAANEPKQRVDRPGCRHNGPPYPEDYAPYREALEEFLRRVTTAAVAK